jgi:Cathepsin propeptide inhibitor domain (I29)
MTNTRSTSFFTSGQYSSPTEERAKFEAFKKSLQALDDLNARERAINGSAVYGVNIFSDLSYEEFKANYLGTKIPANYASNRRLMQVAPAAAHTTATEADWRGIYTTPVKYQGSCGSCWYACIRLSILTNSSSIFLSFLPFTSFFFLTYVTILNIMQGLLCRGTDRVRRHLGWPCHYLHYLVHTADDQMVGAVVRRLLLCVHTCETIVTSDE